MNTNKIGTINGSKKGLPFGIIGRSYLPSIFSLLDQKMYESANPKKVIKERRLITDNLKKLSASAESFIWNGKTLDLFDIKGKKIGILENNDICKKIKGFGKVNTNESLPKDKDGLIDDGSPQYIKQVNDRYKDLITKYNSNPTKEILAQLNDCENFLKLPKTQPIKESLSDETISILYCYDDELGLTSTDTISKFAELIKDYPQIKYTMVSFEEDYGAESVTTFNLTGPEADLFKFIDGIDGCTEEEFKSVFLNEDSSDAGFEIMPDCVGTNFLDCLKVNAGIATGIDEFVDKVGTALGAKLTPDDINHLKQWYGEWNTVNEKKINEEADEFVGKKIKWHGKSFTVGKKGANGKYSTISDDDSSESKPNISAQTIKMLMGDATEGSILYNMQNKADESVNESADDDSFCISLDLKSEDGDAQSAVIKVTKDGDGSPWMSTIVSGDKSTFASAIGKYDSFLTPVDIAELMATDFDATSFVESPVGSFNESADEEIATSDDSKTIDFTARWDNQTHPEYTVDWGKNRVEEAAKKYGVEAKYESSDEKGELSLDYKITGSEQNLHDFVLDVRGKDYLGTDSKQEFKDTYLNENKYSKVILKERKRMAKSVKEVAYVSKHPWILHSKEFGSDMYIGQDYLPTDDKDDAAKFDERDNEKFKTDYYSSLFGYPWSAVDAETLEPIDSANWTIGGKIDESNDSDLTDKESTISYTAIFPEAEADSKKKEFEDDIKSIGGISFTSSIPQENADKKVVGIEYKLTGTEKNLFKLIKTKNAETSEKDFKDIFLAED